MTTEQVRPEIDMETLSLVLPGQSDVFTGDQWQHMMMPLCPKCGETINAERVEVTMVRQLVRHYIFGRWECPNECDPRTVRAQR